MNTLSKILFIGLYLIVLASCTSTPKNHVFTSHRVPNNNSINKINLSHLNHNDASQELMLHSFSIIGTPYRYGGNSIDNGFDCSGMIQYLYQNALGVKLPRTAADMAKAASKIQISSLQNGDLVFFNTSGKNPYSHVGLYIGNNEFIHAPSSSGAIRTEKLSNPYFAKRFTGAYTFFK